MSTTPEERTEIEDVRARLLELEQENARLNEAVRTASHPNERRSRLSWRGFSSALLIIVATVLVPAALVTGWAKTELVDEAAFVQTLAPLADEPAVQAEIVTRASAAIEEALRVDALVGDVFDGLESLGMPDDAKSALDLLRTPAVNGTHALIDGTLTKLVRSDAFADTWEKVLVESHRALVVAASGSVADGAVTVEGNGDIVLHLGPVIDDVKNVLVNDGFDIARQIPKVTTTITVAHSDALAFVGPAYHTSVTLGWVLPFLSFGLFLAGILVARKRRVGVIGSGIGLIAGAGATLIALAGAGAYLTAQAGRFGVTPSAIEAVFSHVTAGMVTTSGTIILLGVALVIVAWLTGESSLARALRGTVESGTAGIAASFAARGFNGGSVGRWLLAQRGLSRGILVIAVVLALVLLPVTWATVIWTAVLALLVWWIVALLESTAALAAASGDEGASAHPESVDLPAEAAEAADHAAGVLTRR